MADVYHNLIIRSTPEAVFNAISTPEGLNEWWTAKASGVPAVGSEYTLWFGPEYDWRAIVTKYEPFHIFEMQIRNDDPEWNNALVGFELSEQKERVGVDFYHKGWPTTNEHYKISCYCWAMYLRILKRYLEFGERVAYADRNDV